MRIGPKQLEALRQLILDRHQAFVANFINPALLSDETRARLERLGLVDPQAQTVQDAFVLGVLAAHAPEAGQKTSYDDLRRRIQRNPIPLSAAEKHAVTVAEMSAGQYITGLASKIQADTGQIVLNLSPGAVQSYLAVTADAVSRAVEDRKSSGQLKSDLGWATGDWNRNLERVANTELGIAMSEGTARAATAQAKGRRVRCIKTSARDCCKYCAKLWLLPDGRPRIYWMDELEANGTNVGRRASEYLPTINPTHANCRCVLRVVPPGFEVGPDDRFYPARDSGAPKIPRNVEGQAAPSQNSGNAAGLVPRT